MPLPMPWASHEPKAISLSLEVLLAAAPDLHKRQLLFRFGLTCELFCLAPSSIILPKSTYAPQSSTFCNCSAVDLELAQARLGLRAGLAHRPAVFQLNTQVYLRRSPCPGAS
mmetsp:Transcript_100280/g.288081  ORF Transcript_100280/g.288081 Transcript_100280/m.288081 type:complete len:112 (-) Transcript_100280:753-1088(-)